MNSLSVSELASIYGHEEETERKEREHIQELRMQAAIERFGEDYEGEEMEITLSPPSDEGDEEKKGDEEEVIVIDSDSDRIQEQQWIIEQQKRMLHPEIDYDYDGEIEDDYWNDPDYKKERSIDEMMEKTQRREF